MRHLKPETWRTVTIHAEHYPQVAGYGAPADVTFDTSDANGCFDVLHCHDGESPLEKGHGRDGDSPLDTHLYDPVQFVAFGLEALEAMQKHGKLTNAFADAGYMRELAARLVALADACDAAGK